MTRDADPEVNAGQMYLDRDFIDYPTAWAIQTAGLVHTDERCSAVQTGGGMLCDCAALPTRWAELKTAHDGSDGAALAKRYMPNGDVGQAGQAAASGNC